ncbi:arginine--tRNA ligase [Candidatus Kaiserbacteria bacterium]|nr:arginine--tRNA ligase [Candidatus Kaiserbacteria bacterium]
MKEKLKEALAIALEGAHVGAGDIPLEHPTELENGDYSSGVALQRAKRAAMAPRTLAEFVVSQLGTIEGVSKIEVAGAGFINFYLTPAALAEAVETARKEDMWGSGTLNAGKKIMVEYTDPNPFKEFHIGHLMSNAIGESIARLMQFSGADVKRANYQGDVGPHVAKAIWGVEKLGVDPHDSAQLGKAYAAGAQAYESDAATKAEIDALNAKVYDRSDPKINKIYDAGRKASLTHFEELYKILGTKFDYSFFESETAPRGLTIVKKHPKVFEESDGAVVFKGEKVGLHTRVFVTSKGLPTYETKDLGLAQMKSETWPFDQSITVTANEQSDYFKVVLAAMKEVLPDVASKVRHISHGMMRFAEGKMSSRTGNVITGESLLTDLTEAAKVRAAESRADNADILAQQIAVAAIKYQILKQASGKDIIFDRERALSLEGDSGPYLQYAHARAHQLVEKAGSEGVALRFPKGDALGIPESANELVRLLHRFPESVEYAAAHSEPHLLTNYLLEFAAAFNSWYAQVHVLDGTPEAAHKVALVDAVRRTLKNGLWILGIPAPEKM